MDWELFVSNFKAGVRTAGALMVGNAGLLLVVKSNDSNGLTFLVAGIIVIFIASLEKKEKS